MTTDWETPPRNPYKGLRAFTGKDAADFFGRARLVEGLIGAMRAGEQRLTRFLAVVGPSGSGKSSVVLAGLLPRLREGALPGSEEWVYLEPLAPGAHPLEALAVTLGAALPGSSLTAIQEDLGRSSRGLHLLAGRLAHGSEARVVLVVDQAEELFTLTGEEDERRQFIDLLVTAVGEPRGALWVILTLRADFYDGPMRHPGLGALMESSSKSVLPMSVAELRAAIEQPAARADTRLRFEGELVGDLLFEVRGQAGALPLLQFTLDQLFEHREERYLTAAAYQALGGVHGALTLHAEATYTGLPTDEHRRLARALFLRLIDPGVTEQDTTRRRAALLELELLDAEETAKLRAVADAFVRARLLVAGEHAGVTTIEVSHEALIREWGRLAAWLREARDEIRLQQALSADAAEWARRGRPGGRLYRGESLDEALRWAERNTPSAIEEVFLAASDEERLRQASAEREQQARELALARAASGASRRAAIRLRYLVGVLILSLAAAAGLTIFAINRAASADANARSARAARAAAVTARTLALSRQLAAQALNHLDDKPDLALLLSVAANEVSGAAEARGSLLRTL
ncbi:MAG TPA: hypothetical protein VNL71_01665, partial [Chloroflexota bacterium]|nr:hypothetical protein [Chloroflexota bacterium]